MFNTFIEILSYGFMQRAILAGVLIALMTGIMGVFAQLRKGAFLGDAVAHSSLAGVSLGLLLGLSPTIIGAVYAIAVSLLLPYIQKKSRLSLDTVLGILLPVSMGLSVLIFTLLPGYQPELMGFLFGNILSITTFELGFLLITTIGVCLALIALLDEFLLSSTDVEYARIIKVNVRLVELLYYFFLSLSIVAGVKLVGVILANALLVIPSSIASQFARSLKSLLLLSPIISIAVTLLGIAISALLNTPSGATIAVLSGMIFVVALIYKNIARTTASG